VSEPSRPAPPAPVPKGEPSRAPSGLSWKRIAVIVLVVYAAVLLFQNSDKVAIDFVFFQTRTRLIWLIGLSMLLGGLIGYLGPRYLQRRRERRSS
jgi:uncharacterized integral membrane protein